jgi:hypothetical protein
MPVTAKVRRGERHCNHMTRSGRDLLLASRTHVSLPSLKRMHDANLDIL